MLKSLFDKFENIIVLDVETTGINPKGDEIIELAALRAEKQGGGAAVSEEFDLLIKLSEGRRLPRVITELTGISEEQLLNEGVLKEAACERFAEMLCRSETLIIAYNAQFDLCFLYYMLQRQGKAGILKGVKMLDALTIYKDRRPYPHKLCDAVSAYALETQNTHRALDDTKATLELMCAMEREQDDLDRYINLFGYNPKFGVSGPRISSIKYLPQPYEATKKLYE